MYSSIFDGDGVIFALESIQHFKVPVQSMCCENVSYYDGKIEQGRICVFSLCFLF